MYWNKTRKYMAVLLSLLMAFGGCLRVPDRTLARSVDEKPEIRETKTVLPVGGLQEAQIYRLNDGEAEKVPSLNMSSRMGRSTTKETVFERGVGDYGYKSLSQAQQSFYHRISESLTAFENGATNGEYTQISLDGKKSYVPFQSVFADLGLDENQASQVWIAFVADHPGLFWLENGCAITSDGLMPIVREDYWGDAATTTQQREQVKQEIEQGVEGYLTVAGYYSTIYDQVREMDEMIIQAVDFAYQSDNVTPEEADWAHTIEGVFAGSSRVVGEGYAKAFAFLLNILDIPNVYVTGTVKNGNQVEAHAWNCVSFDNGNTYYCMDLARDDQGTDSKVTGNSYQYFAMPKSKFEQKHQANTPEGTAGNWLYALPKLGDDMDFTYFMQYGAYGMTSECFSYDAVRGFLSRVKALSPNRLSIYAVMVDTVTLSYIRDVMDLRSMSTIKSEEYGMYIWANPLTGYSKGNSALHNLSTRNMTIDLGRETEKTLSLENVSNANGNYVRWHSQNNEVAVVKAPVYTKMENGASVQIVAKKAGTAVIRAEASNSGTMTCTVTVTGELPVATPTPMPTPTLGPTSIPTLTPEPTATPGPTLVPTLTPEPTATPGPTSVTTPTPGPTVTSGPIYTPTSEPAATSEPTPAPMLTPGPTYTSTPVPAPTSTPELTPAPTSTPGVSPAASATPVVSEEPSASGSPIPGMTQSPGSATPIPTSTPIDTPKPTEFQPGKTTPPLATRVPASVKKVKVGSLYKDKKTKAIYQVTATGKNRTVAYQRSTSDSVKKVKIPSSVTLQGKNYRVTSIAKQAFAGNKKLREVSLGSNIKSIGKKAFYGCKKLKKVRMGKNVAVIEGSAFRKCTSLTLIIIPQKVKKIGDNAFRDCKRLKYIGVKTNSLQLENVGKNAFAGGYGLPRVKTTKKVWRKYSDIFVLRGLSERGIFVINPVDLVI